MSTNKQTDELLLSKLKNTKTGVCCSAGNYLSLASETAAKEKEKRAEAEGKKAANNEKKIELDHKHLMAKRDLIEYVHGGCGDLFDCKMPELKLAYRGFHGRGELKRSDLIAKLKDLVDNELKQRADAFGNEFNGTIALSDLKDRTGEEQEKDIADT